MSDARLGELLNLGEAQFMGCQFGAALKTFSEALKICRSVPSADAYLTLELLHGVGRCHLAMNDAPRALEFFLECVFRLEEGDAERELARVARANLVQVLEQLDLVIQALPASPEGWDEAEGARAAVEAVLDKLERKRPTMLPSSDPDIIRQNEELAFRLSRVGMHGYATVLVDQCIKDGYRADVDLRWWDIGTVFRRADHLRNAVWAFGIQLSSWESSKEANASSICMVRGTLADGLERLGRDVEAITLKSQNLRCLMRVEAKHRQLSAMPSPDPTALRYRQQLATRAWERSEHELAIELFEENLVDAERMLGHGAAETHGYRETLLKACRYAPEWTYHQARSLPHYQVKAAIYEAMYGASHPASLEVQDWVNEASAAARALKEGRSLPPPDRETRLAQQRMVRDRHYGEYSPCWNYLLGHDLLPSIPLGGVLLREGRSTRPPPILGPMWEQIWEAHSHAIRIRADGPLPRQGCSSEGCLYVVPFGSEEIIAVLAPSLQSAWKHLFKSDSSIRRRVSLWVPGRAADVVWDSPILSFESGRNPLRRGRPIVIKNPGDFRDAPNASGIYRIYRLGSDGRPEVYVGRSSNLRRRPGRHEKTLGRQWNNGEPGSVTRIELLPVKPPETSAAWTATDLDAAEALHIRRARAREADGEERVINITLGRNGPASAPGPRMFVWQPPINDQTG